MKSLDPCDYTQLLGDQADHRIQVERFHSCHDAVRSGPVQFFGSDRRTSAVSMQDSNVVASVEQLRAVIPAPSPVVQRKVSSVLDENARQFIGESPLISVSTCDSQFNIDASPKGDLPGFVRVENSSTLLIPERPGTRLTYRFQNLIETGNIGLIFLIPGVKETLRVNGTAVITRDPVLLQEFVSNGKAALHCTRVTVKECFFHCGRR